ncbi:MAG: hypothetical protein ABEJ87_02370 [Candidatus Nanohalobium sp.]
MIRYETDRDVDLERKLDPYPEMGTYASDPWGLEGVLEEEITNSKEAYSALSLNAYHELFSDPRVEEEEVLKVDEEQIQEMQQIMQDNRPSGFMDGRGQLFDIGYRNSPSRLVEDGETGGATIEEAVLAFEDPYQDSDYVLKGRQVFAEKLPLANSFFLGRQKALSDKFYNLAAPLVKQNVGNVDIEVE